MAQINQLSPINPGQMNYSMSKPQEQNQGGGLWETLFGKKQQYNQVPTQTPQAMNFLQQLLSQSGQGLKNPYAGFDPIADQATGKFQRDIIPGLAERFTAMGGSGTRGSSDFGGTLGGAASDLQQGLAALKSQYGLQNTDSLLRQGQLGLTPQYETVNEPETYGFAGNLLASLLPGFQSVGQQFGQQAGQALGNRTFGVSSQPNQDIIAQFMKLLSAGA